MKTQTMNDNLLSQTAVLAMGIDTSSEVLDQDSFRYNSWDCIDKSNLQLFQNEGLIEKRGAWNNWHWTDEADIAVRAVRCSRMTNATETQLHHFRKYSALLSSLPLDDTFLAAEYDEMVGKRVANLREAGIIEEAGDAGKVTVWRLTDFATSVINAVAAQERQAGNFSAGAKRRVTTAIESDD